MSYSNRELAIIFSLSPLPDPPLDPTNRFAEDPRAARLGQRLFFDPRLSGGGSLACASCHQPERSWTDGLPVARGAAAGRRHTPALWNIAYNRWYFWDGRADTLWSQALKPIESPVEMNGSRLAIAHLVQADAELRTAYERLYRPLPDFSSSARFPARGGPTHSDPAHPARRAWADMSQPDRDAVNRVFANVGKALGAFARRIVSRRAPFDVFVEGLRTGDQEKLTALSASAQRGLKLFIGKANCRLCHSGPTFTDREFHNLLLPTQGGKVPLDPGRFEGARLLAEDEFNSLGTYSDAPKGSAAARVRALRASPETWGQMKTPTLRNVEVTPPYMHEGQLSSLEEVVDYYSTLKQSVRADHHQETVLQPLRLTPEEHEDLVAFLKSLTDTSLPGSLLQPPRSPLLNE